MEKNITARLRHPIPSGHRDPTKPKPAWSVRHAARTLIAGAWLAAAVAGAHATTLERVSAADRVRLADLIIEGVVTGVDYRNSDVAGDEHVRLPHTFVTIAIEKVFKGSSSAGDTITLRMQGGPDGAGRVLVVPGIPTFRPGDRDILFIGKNGEAACPLVGWEQGRLRVVQDEVFDAFGRETWVAPSGDFAFGDVRVDVRAFPYQKVSASEGGLEPHAPISPPAGAIHPDAAGFRALLETMAASPALHREPAGPVASVSAGATFFVAAPLAKAPPKDLAPDEPVPAQGERNEAEEQSLREQHAKKNG